MWGLRVLATIGVLIAPIQSNKNCFYAPPSCDSTYPYRSINGSCNNIEHPTWGMSRTPYARVLPNNYADGKYAMPIALSGQPLPLSRKVSNVVNPIGSNPDKIHTLGLMQFGQVVAHDLSFTGFNANDLGQEPVQCCVAGQYAADSNNPRCEPIEVPTDDPLHYEVGTRCLEFERTATTRDAGWTNENEVAEPLNVVTGYFDLSVVYGPTDDVAQNTRTFIGGKMKTETREGQTFLQSAPNATVTCGHPNAFHRPCYGGGDVRLNQSPQLAIIQTSYTREHNRLTDILAELNPDWNDERLYQEARQINIANYQNVVYAEYIPRIIGFDYSEKIGLLYPNSEGCINDYDPTVDASPIVESSSAAMRALHSQIAGSLALVNEDRQTTGSLRLSDHFFTPAILEGKNSAKDTCDLNYDYLTRGLTYQHPEHNNKYFVNEVKTYLFRRRNQRLYGSDLRAIDIQRERDHGVGTYVEARKYCNLPVPNSFEDLSGYISAQDIKNLQSVYSDIRDVSLNSGGLLEYPAAGALVGPTYQCILGEEFRRARVGDRFFYENCDVFSPEQLAVVRRGSFACQLCRNSYCVEKMQPQAFDAVSEENSLEECQKYCSLDLSAWKQN